MRKNQKNHAQVLSYNQVLEMLPELTYLVNEIQDSYQKTKKLRRTHEKLENSNYSEKRIFRENIIIERQLMLEYTKMEEIAEEIEDLGGILQSASEGLVDFVVFLNGKRVHLCWQMGEDNLLYWHFPGQPCAKRKLIAPHISKSEKN